MGDGVAGTKSLAAMADTVEQWVLPKAEALVMEMISFSLTQILFEFRKS